MISRYNVDTTWQTWYDQNAHRFRYPPLAIGETDTTPGGRLMSMTDHVSPQCIIRTVDAQLKEFLVMAFGGVGASLEITAELEGADWPGAVLAAFVKRYDSIMELGVFPDDTVLRYTVIVQPLANLSRTARCTGPQLRAALALLDATQVPEHDECLEVVACRAEIEAELHYIGVSPGFT